MGKYSEYAQQSAGYKILKEFPGLGKKDLELANSFFEPYIFFENIKHTHEDFSEVLRQIDEYEQYCESHERYQNSKAVYAIANIKDVYRTRLKKRDFAKYEEMED